MEVLGFQPPNWVFWPKPSRPGGRGKAPARVRSAGFSEIELLEGSESEESADSNGKKTQNKEVAFENLEPMSLTGAIAMALQGGAR